MHPSEFLLRLNCVPRGLQSCSTLPRLSSEVTSTFRTLNTLVIDLGGVNLRHLSDSRTVRSSSVLRQIQVYVSMFETTASAQQLLFILSRACLVRPWRGHPRWVPVCFQSTCVLAEPGVKLAELGVRASLASIGNSLFLKNSRLAKRLCPRGRALRPCAAKSDWFPPFTSLPFAVPSLPQMVGSDGWCKTAAIPFPRLPRVRDFTSRSHCWRRPSRAMRYVGHCSSEVFRDFEVSSRLDSRAAVPTRLSSRSIIGSGLVVSQAHLDRVTRC